MFNNVVELLLVFDAVGPMSPYHVISPSCAILLSEYTTMLITAVHRSSLVECMERNGCRFVPGRAGRTFALIAACE